MVDFDFVSSSAVFLLSWTSSSAGALKYKVVYMTILVACSGPGNIKKWAVKRMDVRTDGRTDGWMYGRMDGQTDKLTYCCTVKRSYLMNE